MTHWPYLPFLLVWAVPVVALQWLVGGRYLWRARHIWPWVVLGLTVYFTLADAVAISARIWTFDARSLVGISLGPVPIEETLFYLLTALMVSQGFVLFWGAWEDRAALGQRLRRVRRIRRHSAPESAGPDPRATESAPETTRGADRQPVRSSDG